MTISLQKPRRGRPPKSSHHNRDTRAELIRSGLEQLTEHGFTSSGIDQILKKVAVPKGSFYHYFDSKEHFGQVVIESYADYFENKLDSCLLNEMFAPLTRIRNFVEDAKIGMVRHQFKRGCLIGNLGQEVESLPESFRSQLIDIFLSWQSRLTLCLNEAKQQGEISSDADCELLAEYFWIGWEGAVSRAKLIQETKPLTHYITYFINGLPK